MPITSSAKKALRQSQAKAESNKPVRTKARTLLKKARKNPTQENINNAFSALDKAVKKKIFHKGKVSRLKSRLSKLLVSPKQK